VGERIDQWLPFRQRGLRDDTGVTMSPETAQQFEALEAQARRLMAVFTRAGYELVAPSIIQPAGLFLNVIGESLRARTYVFTDPDGQELCLRPDLTVPTCRLHLARHPPGDVPARYCYSGSAFRYQPGGDTSAHPREFRQAGIESFAGTDRAQADADIIALIAQALREVRLERFAVRIGDLGLFSALLAALDMPERWRRRLRHHFWRPEAFRAELMRLTTVQPLTSGLPRGLIEKLDPYRPDTAQPLLEEYLDEAGIELIGTRTSAEIADRLLAAAADAREQPLAPQKAALIEGYAAVKAPAREAAGVLLRLAREANVDLAAGLDIFQHRLKLMEAAGIDVASAEFSAEFGRNLQYYTGFVFEIVVPQLGPNSPVAGGGRYDGLLADVGAPYPVPAVGSSIHTERLLAVLKGAAP
jgi:ATP phosphoribosyltransferase regulatory subunit